MVFRSRILICFQKPQDLLQKSDVNEDDEEDDEDDDDEEEVELDLMEQLCSPKQVVSHKGSQPIINIIKVRLYTKLPHILQFFKHLKEAPPPDRL